jgi:hypothetical protein
MLVKKRIFKKVVKVVIVVKVAKLYVLDLNVCETNFKFKISRSGPETLRFHYQ